MKLFALQRRSSKFNALSYSLIILYNAIGNFTKYKELIHVNCSIVSYNFSTPIRETDSLWEWTCSYLSCQGGELVGIQKSNCLRSYLMQDFRCFELRTLHLFRHEAPLLAIWTMLTFHFSQLHKSTSHFHERSTKTIFSQAKLANTRRKDRLFKKQNFLFGQNNLGDLIRCDWSFAFVL